MPAQPAQPVQTTQPVVVTPPPTPAKPFVLVTNVGGDRVELGAGGSAGVTAKSVYTLYEADDYKLDGPGIGLAQVDFVGATTSIAVLRRADAAKLKKGCRAVETLHYYPPDRLYVTVSGAQKDAIVAALKKIPFVTPVLRLEDYTDRVLRVDPAAGGLKGWLINMEGRKFPEQTATTAETLVASLRKDLTNAFVIKKLTMLDNQAAPFKVKVWIEETPPPSGKARTSSSSSRPTDCYLNLIDCGTSGTVTVLFPNAYHKDNRIQAGRIFVPSAAMGSLTSRRKASRARVAKAIATVKPLSLLTSTSTRWRRISRSSRAC